MTAELFIEGGGDPRSSRSKELKVLFRKGWREFFRTAGLSGRMPRIVRGGGRETTFRHFCKAVRTARSGVLPLLLVDSEGPIRHGHSVWDHLRSQDNPWDRPSEVCDDQAFLMVQVMETWFLADPKTLGSFFGSRFATSAIRQWPDLESVPKAVVFEALERATAGCPTKYAKGKTSFRLLARIQPRLVEASCPRARDLLDRLRGM